MAWETNIQFPKTHLHSHPMMPVMDIDLVNPKERTYFGISLAVSILIYAGLVISVFGIAYIAIGALVGLIAHGLFVGHLRGNGVKITENQFPIDKPAFK